MFMIISFIETQSFLCTPVATPLKYQQEINNSFFFCSLNKPLKLDGYWLRFLHVRKGYKKSSLREYVRKIKVEP